MQKFPRNKDPVDKSWCLWTTQTLIVLGQFSVAKVRVNCPMVGLVQLYKYIGSGQSRNWQRPLGSLSWQCSPVLPVPPPNLDTLNFHHSSIPSLHYFLSFKVFQDNILTLYKSQWSPFLIADFKMVSEEHIPSYTCQRQLQVCGWVVGVTPGSMLEAKAEKAAWLLKGSVISVEWPIVLSVGWSQDELLTPKPPVTHINLGIFCCNPSEPRAPSNH